MSKKPTKTRAHVKTTTEYVTSNGLATTILAEAVSAEALYLATQALDHLLGAADVQLSSDVRGELIRELQSARLSNELRAKLYEIECLLEDPRNYFEEGNK
jgi:hypothetical protein